MWCNVETIQTLNLPPPPFENRLERALFQVKLLKFMYAFEYKLKVSF